MASFSSVADRRSFPFAWRVGYVSDQPWAKHTCLDAGSDYPANECAPTTGFRLVHELAAQGFPVAVTCRVLKVSTSGYDEAHPRTEQP